MRNWPYTFAMWKYSPVGPRWRQLVALVFAVALACELAGCSSADQATQSHDDNGHASLPLPSVRLPLLKYQLTNRRCSDDIIERLLPEADQVPAPAAW